MARNFSATASTTPATLTITGKKCKAVAVRNTGANPLLCNVPAVHGTNDFDTIAAGTERVYVDDNSRINSIIVKTTSLTTGYNAGVIRGSA